MDVICFVLCVLLIFAQQGLLDYFFIRHLQQKIWYSWLIADFVIIVAMIGRLILFVRHIKLYETHG